MKDSLITLPLAQLKRAVSIREQIESLEIELNQLLGAPGFMSTNGATSTQKRGLTTAAQRLLRPKADGFRSTRLTPFGNKRLSPSGRAKISAVVTARWERYRAAKAKSLKAG